MVEARRYENSHLFIREDGLLYSATGKRFLSNTKNNGNGYLIFSLTENKKYKNHYTHRAVAKTFIPNPDSKPVVNHIDGDKQNNCVSNLEWVTVKENAEHAKRLSLTSSRSGNVFNLTDQQVIAIRHSDLLETQLIELYDITQNDVRNIRGNLTFTHIPLTGQERGRERRQYGVYNNNTTLNPIEERVIEVLLECGKSINFISSLLQIGKYNIQQIKKRLSLR